MIILQLATVTLTYISSHLLKSINPNVATQKSPSSLISICIASYLSNSFHHSPPPHHLQKNNNKKLPKKPFKAISCFAAGNAPASDRKDLLSELELMKTFKPHPHVIKLLGCVTESGRALKSHLVARAASRNAIRLFGFQQHNSKV